MDITDYYAALGVAQDASQDEIKRAYRRLARQSHPDIAAAEDAQERFKAINQAYDVLKDPARRAEYDALRLGGGAGPRAGGDGSRWDGGFSFAEGGSKGAGRFSDLFGGGFGFRGGPGGGFGAGGADIHAGLTLDIEESFRGGTRTLTLGTPVLGPDGRIRAQDRTVTIRIPKGIREGQHIRVAPAAGGGGDMGDIYLEVSFAPHPVYRAEGRDLLMELPVAPWEAALGAKIVLPTPAGKVDLRIPENARSGQRLRLRGKGLPSTPPGDLYATLRIVNPRVTTPEARALFERMAREMPFDPRAKPGG